MMDSSVTKQPFWALDVAEVYQALESRASGLGDAEVGSRRGAFGPNEIREKERETKIRIIFKQTASPLILVLIGAGILTILQKEWVDVGVIFAAVFVNVFLGFYQENKAETALSLLKSYVRTHSRVRRNGREREIDASELVPGDIIHLSQGDRVPADGRLIFSNGLEADEAVLTGESLPVEKNVAPLPVWTALANRTSIVFGGTLVTRGLGDAIVTATGNATEFGKIASLVAARTKESTPLQRAILRFTKTAGFLLMVLVSGLFALGLYEGRAVWEMFRTAVAVAVSAVPEGLPIVLTVVLAVGVQRLAAHNAVVRRLLAAETLGSTTLILTDKTGTLTQATMKLTATVPYGDTSVAAEERLLRDAILNTDVALENPDDPPVEWRVFGDTVEMALVKGAGMRGIFLAKALAETKVLERLPFSAEHKFSASVSLSPGGEGARVVLFGAPEAVLRYASLASEEAGRIQEEVARLARNGEKVLGVASGHIEEAKEELIHDFQFPNLSFRGLITFRDPLRPRVAAAVHRIAADGVKTIILTGDHRGTAEAVARELQMVDDDQAILEGDDLHHLEKDELRARAPKVAVYARVTPEQKVSLVKLYQELGEVVAMVGDGVNDAPALEAADIGVAVGSGTDVAKSAADMVILDDNYETVVRAIEEGRKIFDNIRKVIVYLLTNSFDELILIGGALLCALPLPINALQILFVNFISDGFPAVALAFEKGIDDPPGGPRRINRGIFDPEMRFLILVIGFSFSAFLFALYYVLIQWGFSGDTVRTFIFTAFSTATLFLIFSVRSLQKSIVRYNPFSNGYIVAGVLAGFSLTLAIVYVPFLQRIFDTVSLPWPWLAGVLGVGLVDIGALELGKWLFRKKSLAYEHS